MMLNFILGLSTEENMLFNRGTHVAAVLSRLGLYLTAILLSYKLLVAPWNFLQSIIL